MVYQWKTGARVKTAPEVAAAVMNDLAERNQLNAEMLVNVSRPEDAPLHQEFEWDDPIAAEEWRKQQARCLIHSLVLQEDDEDTEPVRVFFKIHEASPNYEPTQVILQSPESTEALRNMALKELIAFKNKYAAIIRKINGEKEVNSLQMKMEAG